MSADILTETLHYPRARQVWLDGLDTGHRLGQLDGYTQGRRHGYDRGYAAGYQAALADVEAARLAEAEALVRQVADWLPKMPDYADLADLRGEHTRAARQRQILAERGVAS